MNNLWKKTSGEYESSAKVVDGNLILSLPDAINPIVWRMELGSVKTSALEVRPQSSDGTFMLALKTPKGEIHEIAPFASKDNAVRALMRVTAAMQNAHGKISPVAATVSPQTAAPRPISEKDGSSVIKWLLTLGGVLIVIFMFAFLSSLAPQQVGGEEETATTITGQPDAESGVPQSAEQMLRGF